MRIKPDRLLIGLFALCAAFAGTACQKNRGAEAASDQNASYGSVENGHISPFDKGFLVYAEKAETRTQNLARVAMEKSADGNVRDYAHKIETDSSQTLQSLVELMNKKGISQDPSLLVTKDDALDRLKGLPTGAVQDEFISLMAADYQEVLARFRQTAETGEDEDVRAFANGALPSLQEKLGKALEIEARLSKPNRR